MLLLPMVRKMPNFTIHTFFPLVIVVCIWLFVGCEKPYQPAAKDDDTEQEITDGRKVKIIIANAEGTTDISQVCTLISYCVFTANGELYTVKHQASSDNDFGCKTLYMADGNYRLVVIAHSGVGNISIESEDKIKFKDNKITDTFAYSADVDITEDCSLNLVLNRIVANVHVVIPGAMPQDVKQMEFYYTGGSSTYSCLTGYGSVNSRQTEYRDVTTDMEGQATAFDIYTFPHETNGTLKLTIKALAEDKSVVKSIQYSDIQVVKNTKTVITSFIFGGSSSDGDDTTQPDICIPINTSEITDIPRCF